jgi:anti-anti-sigma regulatory factor
MHDHAQYYCFKLGRKIVTARDFVKISNQIRSLIEHGRIFLLLDFSSTREISGSFAGFLIGIVKKLETAGGNLTVTGTGPQVREILRLVGFFDCCKGVSN